MSAESEYVAAQTALLRERARMGTLWLPVDGTSMGPRFPPDAEVFVVHMERSPRCGEVWLYASNAGDVVAHRYFRRTAAGLVFRGDARERSDPPIEPSQLIGRVTRLRRGAEVSAVPVLGAISSFARAISGRLRSALGGRRRT